MTATSVFAVEFKYENSAWSATDATVSTLPSSSSTFYLTADTTFNVAENQTATIRNIWESSSSSSLTKTGAGTLKTDLSYNNNYSGATTVEGGTFQVGGASPSNSNAGINLKSVITVTGNTSVLRLANVGSLGYYTTSSNVKTLTLQDGGTLDVSAKYAIISRNLIMNSGKVTDSYIGETPSEVGQYIFDSTIQVTGGANNVISADTISFRKDATGDTLGGAIDVAENAQLTISSNIFSGTSETQYAESNNFSAHIVKQSGGTLVFADNDTSNSEKNLQTLTVEGGTLQIIGGTVTVAGETKITNGTVTDADGNETATTGTLAISGGTVTLTGATTVENGGKLAVSGGTVKGDGVINITENGTFDFSDGTVENEITLTHGGAIKLSNRATIANLTYGGGSIELADSSKIENLKMSAVWTVSLADPDEIVAENVTFDPNTQIELLLDENYGYYIGKEFKILTAMESLATPDGSDLASYNWDSLLSDSYVWNLNYVGLDGGGYALRLSVDANAIPEPATWTLLILGATALVFMRRKR